MGCTTLGVVPPATRDGQVYLSWNLDVLHPAKLFLDRFKLFVVPNEPYSYLGFGIPGLASIGLMNETGLSAVGNAVGVTDGSPVGKLSWSLWSECMKKCSNVEEVAEYFEKTPRMTVPGKSVSIFTNLNMIFADASGEAVLIEYSGRYVAVRYIEETGYLVSANHHQFLDRQKSGSSDPSTQKAIIGSYARLGRAWELAERWKGEFDLGKVKEFTSDHGLNYDLLKPFGMNTYNVIDDATICCHYWNYQKYMQQNKLLDAFEVVAEGETRMVFILEPIKKRLHYCPEKPCRTPFKSYNVAKAFEKARKIKEKKKIKNNSDLFEIPILSKLIYWTFSSLDRLIPI